jgi:phospholipid/cholesterol/gamma-HCH transport system substrate-binding protein
VGAFVVGGLLLFSAGLFLIGDRRLLFEDQYEIETALTKVTGLQVGTGVRIAGLAAGEVQRIDIPAQPSRPFVVRLRLRRDLGHLVRTDSVASVQTDGLVGNAFIGISPGSDGAAPVAAGGRIGGVAPVEFSDVVASANAALATFNDMVQTISPQVSGTLDRLNTTVDGVNAVVGDVRVGVQNASHAATRSLDATRRVVDDVGAIVADVRSGRGTIGQLITDDALYTEIRRAGTRAAEGLEQFRDTGQQVRRGVERLLRPGGSVDQVLADARGATTAVEEVITDLAETTEAFKRNWLVRGFFRDRGFFDIDALTPTEYRQFAEDDDERAVRRIWLEAPGLFVTDEAGEEQLSQEGRRRLDLAMGTLLEFRRDGPLIVEGYAAADDSTSAQLLRSDTRARLVREHLVRRFRRDASITGAIGLGPDARESPRGTGRWEGVALALHVPK